MSENPGESADLDAPAASSPGRPLNFDIPHFDLVEKGANTSDIETRGSAADGN